jgi:hypothetical protein
MSSASCIISIIVSFVGLIGLVGLAVRRRMVLSVTLVASLALLVSFIEWFFLLSTLTVTTLTVTTSLSKRRSFG